MRSIIPLPKSVILFLHTMCLLALVLGFFSGASAQNSLAYDISFPNAAHHEAEVSVTATGLPDVPLEMRMSRTSPGRYALHEFAKNVYNVQAFDGEGNPLLITRPNPHQWNISDHDGTVRVTYTLFGDRADGTYTGIDLTHAHLNMPATFMWPRNAWDTPISITFHLPDPAWNVATQLMPTGNSEAFLAPNLAYFLDSPTEISAFTMRSWEVSSGDRTYTIRLVVHHDGTEAEVDAYAEMARKVVDEQIAIFGETPDYEGGTYTFLADYLPHVNGDGMEHRNSTILSSTASLANNSLRLLGTLSHEYFHQWNVERLRPRTLEPFDFEAANMSDALWFAEGFTSYFDDLTIRRTGLIGNEDYAWRISGTLSYVLSAPGSRFFSPVDMSRQAPFVDAARSVDPQNRQNTFISYYSWGSAIGLGLDLTLRTRFSGVTLDDYMRALWINYGKPERPYTLADLEHTLAALTQDADFADSFFRWHVYGSEMMDYEAVLAQGGFLLRKENPGTPWLGARIDDEEEQVILASGSMIDSPLYRAGLDNGDVILRLGNHAVTSTTQVDDILASHQPGDTLSIHFEQRGRQRQATLVLAEDPQLEVVTYETAGLPITEAIRAFREQWLGSRVQR